MIRGGRVCHVRLRRRKDVSWGRFGRIRWHDVWKRFKRIVQPPPRLFDAEHQHTIEFKQTEGPWTLGSMFLLSAGVYLTAMHLKKKRIQTLTRTQIHIGIHTHTHAGNIHRGTCIDRMGEVCYLFIWRCWRLREDSEKTLRWEGSISMALFDTMHRRDTKESPKRAKGSII